MSMFNRSAEQKATDDGYHYTGSWEHSFNKDKIVARKAEYIAEGYKVRQVAKSGGIALYVKDTKKTLAAKAAKEAELEAKRIQKAAKLRSFLDGINTASLSDSQLSNIKYEIDKVLLRTW